MLFEEAFISLETMTGFKPTPSSGGWLKARCPAHADRTPSLSLRRADDGGVIFYCFAGCTHKAIVEILAAGKPSYDPAELGPPKERAGTPPWEREHEIEATYDYTDSAGTLVFQKVRFRGKDFVIRKPAPANWSWDWDYRRGGYAPMLYNLPGILEPQTIFIVEGEKDADALIAGGLPATCTSSPKDWAEDFNQYFVGKDVCIIADNDTPGIEHAALIYKGLGHVVKSKTVIRALPGVGPGGDVSDWLAVGNTVEDLIALYFKTAPR